MDIQFFAAHAGLDDTVEILGIDGDDLVHLAHIERDAAVDGERIAFDRRPRPEWHDRDIGRRTQLYQRDDIVRRVSKDDGLGQHGSEMRLARSMLPEHRFAPLKTVPKPLLQRPYQAGWEPPALPRTRRLRPSRNFRPPRTP